MAGPVSVTDAAETQLRLAIRLLNDRRLSEAAWALEAAERMQADPDECAGARWFLSMLLGDFAAAWRAGDAILERGRPDAHRLWNGEPIHGQRVMIRCLHGFGDAVQMLRLLPLVRAAAAHVIVQVAPRLVPLARCLPGADEVITWGAEAEQRPEPAWEVQIEVMELPFLLRLERSQLPYAMAYLHLPTIAREGAVRAIAHLRGEHAAEVRCNVGIVWAAGSWNPTRSIPVTDMRELFSLTRDLPVRFWSLQGQTASAEADAIFAEGLLQDGSSATDGVVALAATIAEMDLVITVDTLAAHLAGALAVPAWLLLQEKADWRWMTDREDSPWYPSLRLFRCGAGEVWTDLLPQVRRELATKLSSAARSSVRAGW